MNNGIKNDTFILNQHTITLPISFSNSNYLAFQWSKQSTTSLSGFFIFSITPQIALSSVFAIVCMPCDASNQRSETALLSTDTWYTTNNIQFYTEAVTSVNYPNSPNPENMWSQVIYIGI